MEDIFEETSTDIDGCDAKNPLAVVDYVEDLYAYYKKMEVNMGWIMCLVSSFLQVLVFIFLFLT